MRSVYEVSKELAAYAPTGGDTWQNVGMRQVPVRLLTELREAVERERRVKVFTYDPITTHSVEFLEELDPETQKAAKEVCEYAGAWRFDEPEFTYRPKNIVTNLRAKITGRHKAQPPVISE